MTFIDNYYEESKTTMEHHGSCFQEVKHKKMDDKRNCLKMAWSAIENKYGIVLGGFLKTRYVNRNKDNQKFAFSFQSSWKLRYWRLTMTDEGLIFEKSRRPDSKPYKGILLPFGKTSFWQIWGKRGDPKYRFGFTLRVECNNVQMDVAVDSDRVCRQWMNVLNTVFHNDVRNARDLLECLSGNDCITLQGSKRSTMAQNLCRIEEGKLLLKTQYPIKTTQELKKTYSKNSTFHSMNNNSESFFIPRRFSSHVYGDDGYINNCEKYMSCSRKNITLPKIIDEEELQDDSEECFYNRNTVLNISIVNPEVVRSDNVNNIDDNPCRILLTEVEAPANRPLDAIHLFPMLDRHNKNSKSISHSDSIQLSQINLDISDETSLKSQVYDHSSEEKHQQLLSPTTSSSVPQQTDEIFSLNSSTNDSNSTSNTSLKENESKSNQSEIVNKEESNVCL